MEEVHRARFGVGLGSREPPCPLQAHHPPRPPSGSPTWKFSKPCSLGNFMEVNYKDMLGVQGFRGQEPPILPAQLCSKPFSAQKKGMLDLTTGHW